MRFIQPQVVSNNTAGYHRHVFRPPIYLNTPFKKMKTFLKKFFSVSSRSTFWGKIFFLKKHDIKKTSNFEQKVIGFLWNIFRQARQNCILRLLANNFWVSIFLQACPNIGKNVNAIDKHEVKKVTIRAVKFLSKLLIESENNKNVRSVFYKRNFQTKPTCKFA